MVNKKWYGSAGICMNENKEILMVKQGKREEKKVWAVPSGGKNENESFEECCLRELKEETGYDGKIIRPLLIKKGMSFGYVIEVHYFEVEIIGGTAKIQDPDHLIHEIGWKSAEEIKHLELSFPEDRKILLDYIME